MMIEMAIFKRFSVAQLADALVPDRARVPNSYLGSDLIFGLYLFHVLRNSKYKKQYYLQWMQSGVNIN